MQQNNKKIALILSLVCIILLIIISFALKAAIIKEAETQDWIKTTAEIVNIDFTVTEENEQIIISFNDELNNIYIVPLGFFSSNMYIGMKISIAYNPENPNSIIYLGNNSFFINYGGSIILIICAIISGATAIRFFIKIKRKNKDKIFKKLK